MSLQRRFGWLGFWRMMFLLLLWNFWRHSTRCDVIWLRVEPLMMLIAILLETVRSFHQIIMYRTGNLGQESCFESQYFIFLSLLAADHGWWRWWRWSVVGAVVIPLTTSRTWWFLILLFNYTWNSFDNGNLHILHLHIPLSLVNQWSWVKMSLYVIKLLIGFELHQLTIYNGSFLILSPHSEILTQIHCSELLQLLYRLDDLLVSF